MNDEQPEPKKATMEEGDAVSPAPYPARFLRTTEARFSILAIWGLGDLLSEREAVSFWAADRERLLALVHTTNDIHPDARISLIMRDAHGRYRPFVDSVRFPTVRAAEDAISGPFGEDALQREFDPPPAVGAPGVDLFAAVAAPEKLAEAFRYLRDGHNQSAARELLRELGHWIADQDGNLVKDLQTTGYSARVWEIYLNFAVRELGFSIAEQHVAPDFELVKGDRRVFIEATTVNPIGNARDILKMGEMPTRPDDIWTYLEEVMPLRFGSPLHSKMQKRYWEKAHVSPHPFVIAIADFHDSASMTWSHTAMPIYLYGRSAEVRVDESGNRAGVEKKLSGFARKEETILPFFEQEGSAHVAAILFSNAGTISKFNRMGARAGFGDRYIVLRRIGARQNPYPDAIEPLDFSVDVESLGYDEEWADELVMYHNPNALIPVDEDLFPGIVHYFMENGEVLWRGPPFRVFASVTSTLDVLGRDKDISRFKDNGVEEGG